MKIKRFEASSMSEALRMVKKEFGEEAVILSAKTAGKAGRLLGGKRGGQVVVTAAIDPAAVAPDPLDEVSAAADTVSGQKAAASGQGNGARPAGGIAHLLQRYTPITRTGQEKLKPKFIRLMTESADRPVADPVANAPVSVYDRLREGGMGRALATELADQITAVAADDQTDPDETLAAAVQIIEARGWVAPVRGAMRKARRIVVLVGPAGAGKTAVAAKMAGHAVLYAKQSVGVISLDDQRIAGTVELERFCNLMGVALQTARDSDQLQSALACFDDCDLVVIDTPGLDPLALAPRERLAGMLMTLDQADVHLVFNATTQSRTMERVSDFFGPLGVTRLLPTHLDWCDRFGPVLEQVASRRWPLVYLGCDARLPEGLQVAGARAVAERLFNNVQEQHEGLQANPETDNADATRPPSQSSVQGRYVANRNSDIFHQRDCKAVKRINDDNVWLFRDGTDAMAQGFKPCRMCCASLLAPKTIDRPAQARYAGGRK
ncbi:Ada metal-binding domain-containing protein [Desulfatitalea alkaliphila]|uniref:Flagellar biosynthesis protein FlhF n=1 Tax=Desulfatitalea alkaliphila TaxID=2929485 RepID=A0AA41R445_9BACT|nr:Ada metal-binding domain-containing protein [Desulfatitalea alkaliphila]MCJ8501291.1 hypothetical protein [Desulfatitalea alkaliphila]